MNSPIQRRSFLTAAAAAIVPAALGQTQRDWTGRQPVRYTDPDLISLDKRFDKYLITNTTVQRLWTGALWAEGTAWSGVGRYLVWSDIPNNRQMRFMEEDGHISLYHSPSEYSNGNTFDFEGRQISCQHGMRRVVRYENDGTVTVIADKWQGKPLNSPNDVVVHPDGAIWFTDPPYGIMGNYEGYQAKQEIKEAVYRVDKGGKMDKLTDELDKPNGICFSPDYKKLYVCDTGGPHDIQVFDVVDGKSVRNKKQLTDMTMQGHPPGLADGIRADVDGNIWAGAGRGGPGYDGVHVFTPAGERIGQIVLPEVCANICFGGARRNRLFMAASQSLYAVYVGTRGAHLS
ncbi:MAG TPA: SMP-30/gluconolactonase/LRE family protein [Candidatus Acidoferrales bacterium]|nr:SMP-30/gluconolactonase/LRE family protein [Candidatus Acidoferrales bacterium]